jgi:alanine racemase
MNAHFPEAILTVDLNAIAGNWRFLSARLKPGCRAAAVVKADGYGLGASQVSRALQQAGCARFFVATLEEAISLRAALPQGEILVMNGPEAISAAEYPRYRLMPVLNSLEQAEAWRQFAARKGGPLAAALQIDSGMSRLGISPAEATELAGQADFAKAVELKLVMSHLACSDRHDHPLNRQQWQIFNQARSLFPAVEASLASSSGIFLGPDFHYDWVRPGAALFGVNPLREAPNPMAQVLRLQAKILQVRDVDEGIAVGYGASHRTSGPARLATVAMGYADGLLRTLSNRGHGQIGDKLVPMVGRVSMDLTVFDVTGMPAAETAPGRMIDLIGSLITVDKLAKEAGTIGYEILTALGPRIHRHYVGSGAA